MMKEKNTISQDGFLKGLDKYMEDTVYQQLLSMSAAMEPPCCEEGYLWKPEAGDKPQERVMASVSCELLRGIRPATVGDRKLHKIVLQWTKHNASSYIFISFVLQRQSCYCDHFWFCVCKIVSGHNFKGHHSMQSVAQAGVQMPESLGICCSWW